MDIGYCASALNSEGHESFLIDTNAETYTTSRLLNHIRKISPDVVIVKNKIYDPGVAIDLTRNIKKEISIPVFLIGQIPTFYPSKFVFRKSPIDGVLLGEPEAGILELIRSLEEGKKLNFNWLYDSKNQKKEPLMVKDLDSLNFPEHGMFLNGRYNFFYPTNLKQKLKMGFMLSSRGCLYDCMFCSLAERESYFKKYRTRSHENVVDEIEFLFSKGVNMVYFLDDLFLGNKKRVKNICKEIMSRKIDVRWSAQARVDCVDEDTLRIMKKAGCSTLCFGVESGSEELLGDLKKGIRLKDTKTCFKLTKKFGINTVAFFMLGHPRETIGTLRKSLKLCQELKPDMVQISFFTPYPSSPASKKYVIENTNILNTYSHVTSSFSDLPTNTLEEFQKFFYLRFYVNPHFFYNYFLKSLTSHVKNWRNQTRLFYSVLRYMAKSARNVKKII
jgi:radical SAM superfamily enzyme YgiQ (UPF0313 family)